MLGCDPSTFSKQVKYGRLQIQSILKITRKLQKVDKCKNTCTKITSTGVYFFRKNNAFFTMEIT